MRPISRYLETRGSAAVAVPLIVVVALVVVVAIPMRGADPGIDEQREELAALDQLGIGTRLVHLDVEQEPALPEDLLGVDDARRLLVLRQEVWIVRDRRIEELRVVGGDLDELAAADRVHPDLGDAVA